MKKNISEFDSKVSIAESTVRNGLCNYYSSEKIAMECANQQFGNFQIVLGNKAYEKGISKSELANSENALGLANKFLEDVFSRDREITRQYGN